MHWKQKMCQEEQPPKEEPKNCAGCEEPILGIPHQIGDRYYHKKECFYLWIEKQEMRERTQRVN